MRIRSFVAWLSLDHRPSKAPAVAPDSAHDARKHEWTRWRVGPLDIIYAPRVMESAGSATHDRLPTMVLGDDGEWNADAPDANLASGVPVRYDEAAQELIVHTSVVALPPVFLYRGADVIALTSDVHLLSAVPGARLELDSQGVLELGHFGHPVGHRTLFRDVELVPGGGRLSLSPRSGATFRRTWQMPERTRVAWPEFIEAQIDIFARAVQRSDVATSFLSLTAGLDTRTVFATLAAQGRLVPAVTMTGTRRSLDARIAGQLCRAYGVRHDAVTFDDRFTRDLARYVETASRLSGGIASVDQAPEVYLYDQVGGAYAARMSGNLGNQVGRGGTEGVSVRAADLGVLSARLRGRGAPAGHWLLEHLDRSERETLEFILQSEVPFTLVGNYGVGNHFAAQQSPYASRALIETLAMRPSTSGGAPSGSKMKMRLRDLKHRFLGEPEEHSFQRTLVKRNGGYAAHCPVNWGWRPAGGVSPGGLAFGAATLLGMFARATGLDGGILRLPLRLTGLPALHDFRESRRWLRDDLRAFTLDTLQSQKVHDADLFEWRTLNRILDEHFQGGRDHYHTVTFALDVSLAHRLLCT